MCDNFSYTTAILRSPPSLLGQCMELVGRLALGVMCTRSLEGSLSTQVLSLVYGTSAGWSHVEEGIEIAEPENYVVWSAPPGARREDVFPTVPLPEREPVEIPTDLHMCVLRPELHSGSV